jgi:hypothetical protein
MKLEEGFLTSMREAMTLLRTRGPAEATEAIQRALRGDTDGAVNTTASWDATPRTVSVPFEAPATTSRTGDISARMRIRTPQAAANIGCMCRQGAPASRCH